VRVPGSTGLLRRSGGHRSAHREAARRGGPPGQRGHAHSHGGTRRPRARGGGRTWRPRPHRLRRGKEGAATCDGSGKAGGSRRGNKRAMAGGSREGRAAANSAMEQRARPGGRGGELGLARSSGGGLGACFLRPRERGLARIAEASRVMANQREHEGGRGTTTFETKLR
jgi:hypothetical protein